MLYLEGTTDKQNIIALAQHIKHPIYETLTDRVFVYYTQSPDSNHEEFEMNTGYYQTHKKHFAALKPLVENLKGIAVFDNDNQNRSNEDADNGLKIRFWKQYELENYFISPQSVVDFMTDYFTKIDGGNLFTQSNVDKFQGCFEEYFLKKIFKDDIIMKLYKKGSDDEKIALYKNNSQDKKVSSLLEDVFKQFSQKNGGDMPLKKGDFYKIVPFCAVNSIDDEVKKIFDEIKLVLSP